MPAKVIEITKKQKKLIGSVKPRVMSIPLRGKSRGKEFAEFCEKVGMPLYPWQKFIADDFLSIDANDMYRRKTVAILISRQNGKTQLIALRILAELFLWNPSGHVVAMSSVRGLAEDTFEMVCKIIERNEFLRNEVQLNRNKVGYFGNGAYYVDTFAGGRYEVVAATRDGSRGKTADLLFVDELREITEDAWAAAKPTTTARPNAQTYVTSNAGDAFSIVLNELRDRAISYPSPTLGWYEYSAPPRMKPDDKAGWAMANPSLGHSITEETLQEMYSTMSIEKFRTEHLCQWVASLSSPFPSGAWESCGTADLKLEAGGGLTIFAFDVAKSRRTADLLAGQLLPDGRVATAIIAQWKSDVAVDELKIAVEIKKWCDKFRPQMVCFDHYSTQSIAKRLEASGVKMVDVSGQNFYTACGDLLDAILAKRIVHPNQPEMSVQMDAVASKENDSSWRIVRRPSAGDVSAPIALAMIVHKIFEPQSRAQII
jgi:phage terminase large subunit-like protein